MESRIRPNGRARSFSQTESRATRHDATHQATSPSSPGLAGRLRRFLRREQNSLASRPGAPLKPLRPLMRCAVAAAVASQITSTNRTEVPGQWGTKVMLPTRTATAFWFRLAPQPCRGPNPSPAPTSPWASQDALSRLTIALREVMASAGAMASGRRRLGQMLSALAEQSFGHHGCARHRDGGIRRPNRGAVDRHVPRVHAVSSSRSDSSRASSPSEPAVRRDSSTDTDFAAQADRAGTGMSGEIPRLDLCATRETVRVVAERDGAGVENLMPIDVSGTDGPQQEHRSAVVSGSAGGL
jgi:hypothetical protein